MWIWLQRTMDTTNLLQSGGFIVSVVQWISIKKALAITKDPSHQAHGLFQIMRYGRRYRSLGTSSKRAHDSTYPYAVRLLNSSTSLLVIWICEPLRVWPRWIQTICVFYYVLPVNEWIYLYLTYGCFRVGAPVYVQVNHAYFFGLVFLFSLLL